MSNHCPPFLQAHLHGLSQRELGLARQATIDQDGAHDVGGWDGLHVLCGWQLRLLLATEGGGLSTPLPSALPQTPPGRRSCRCGDLDVTPTSQPSSSGQDPRALHAQQKPGWGNGAETARSLAWRPELKAQAGSRGRGFSQLPSDLHTCIMTHTHTHTVNAIKM